MSRRGRWSPACSLLWAALLSAGTGCPSGGSGTGGSDEGSPIDDASGAGGGDDVILLLDAAEPGPDGVASGDLDTETGSPGDGSALEVDVDAAVDVGPDVDAAVDAALDADEPPDASAPADTDAGPAPPDVEPDVPPADLCVDVFCGDGDPCTADSCDPATGGCGHDPIPDCDSCAVGADCDDGDPCTKDKCGADGLCVYTPDPCDDVNPCTIDGCSSETGCTHDPDPCDDDDACTSDGCDPGVGCQHAAVTCDDADPCTLDGCDPAVGCTTTTITCQGGTACVPNAPCACSANAECADDNPCTVDACDPDGGICKHDPAGADGAPCDDGDLCTSGDACSAGVCEATPTDCDDANPCTKDSCNTGTGTCANFGLPHQGDACDDGDPCTSADACDFGVCVGDAMPCEDENPCTVDACDPSTVTCVFDGAAAAGLGCDDADPCTVGDACAGGACVGASPTCDDGNPCTAGTCDPATGACTFETAPLDGAPCDDGEACTVDDLCVAAFCEGSLKGCDDADPCTGDACDAASGECLHEALPGCGVNHPCVAAIHPGSSDDAVTACVCAAAPECCSMGWSGTCVDAAQATCGVVCGDCEDLPPGSIPCLSTAHCGQLCDDDDDACNGGWVCGEDGLCAQVEPIICETAEAGSCVTFGCQPDSGTCMPAMLPDACDDQDACTTDLCDGATGACSHPPVPSCLACGGGETACETDTDCGPCDNGNACDGGWGCAEGFCLPTPPITCVGAASGCAASSCDPVSGECVPVGDDALCDDEDPCTTDTCDAATGACASVAMPGCLENSPCAAAPTPGSKDPDASDCVCGLDPACCEVAWDGVCVALAIGACAVPCDCDGLADEELTCTTDAGCGFCGLLFAPCEGGWTCLMGQCAAEPSPNCSDATSGCVLGTCDPDNGSCGAVSDHASCDDEDPCTTDFCNGTTGDCAAAPIPGCEGDPCSSLACATAAECLSVCDADDLCAGSWACVGGACAPTAPVVCDTAGDLGCLVNACDPATGTCTLGPKPLSCDDGEPCTLDACDPVTGVCVPDPAAFDGLGCDDGDACTGGDACSGGTCVAGSSPCADNDPCTVDGCDPQTGACVPTPAPECTANHPCVASGTGLSSDPVVTACVCAIKPECCSMGWSAGCVGTAQSECGLECGDCASLPAGAVPCALDGDCAALCDDGDPCNGTWSCEDGVCAATAPITCPVGQPGGCTTEACHPTTGACAPSLLPGACDDLDPCTTDACDPATDGCTHTPVAGCLDCAAAPAPCVSDLDCGACDDGDLCDGGWICEASVCAPTAPVTCPPPDAGSCAVHVCEPTTGACVTQADDALCDDADGCTADACDAATAECTFTELPGCLANSPCKPAVTPGSSDPAASACVCAVMAGCCDETWTAACVTVAIESCDVACDCAGLAASDLACAGDADCGFCGDDSDACNGGWACVDGHCAPFEPVVCEDPGGCLVGTCDAVTGACAAIPDAAACDDGEPCTSDVCVAQTGACAHSDIPGCQGDPCASIVCAGPSECAIACGDDGDPCTGGWDCVGGSCVATAPITCDTGQDVGCLVTSCVPGSGACEQKQDHASCLDDAPCTLDACEQDGQCVHLPGAPGCGDNAPCETANTPGSSDAATTSCVCALESYCCQVYWDAGCVGVATASCGAACP